MDNGGIMIKNYQMLKEQINYVIQNSGLDIGAAYFIMKDIMSNLEHSYYAQINKELLNEKETKDKEQEVKTSSESSNKSN